MWVVGLITPVTPKVEAIVAAPAIAVVELATVEFGVNVICATADPEASLLKVSVFEVEFIILQSSPLSSR